MTHRSSARQFLGSAALIATALASSGVSAQVRYGGEPAAVHGVLGAEVPSVILPPPDVEKLKKEDEVPKVGPFRYGVVLPATVDLRMDGAPGFAAGDLLVRRIRISAPGAHSLGLEFSRFDLPPGGKLFVYDDALQTVFGSYDQRNRIPTTGEFVIEPFPGDSVIVEYSQPVALPESAEIVVSGVIYDYRGILEIERRLNTPEGGATDGGCPLVDVNCPDGNPFGLLKRATVRTLSGGGLCSGSLINNTANDGTRYVYTANHCGQGTTTVFRFNYQTAGCGIGAAPTTQNASGAAVLANDLDTDGRLMRITNAIPASYNPYFAGWSRSTSNLTFGMSMHHPNGGPKKISIDTNGGGQNTVTIFGIGPVKIWNMDFQTGSTEGGSSGGPLFDQNHRTRGTLTGGPSSPCSISYYGRFYSFWNETTIAQYLDPIGSGATELDGFDPFGGPPVPPTISGISPGSVQAFAPGQVMLSGTGFADANTVHVGSIALAPPFGFTIVDASTISLHPPQPTALGPVNVTVVNGSGTSNAIGLDYTETTPPQLSASFIAVGGQPHLWSFGGPANDPWYLLVAVNDGTTFPFLGSDILLSSFVLTSGLPNAAGLGGTSVVVPTGIAGTVFYSQIVTIDVPVTDIQISNIATTTVFF